MFPKPASRRGPLLLVAGMSALALIPRPSRAADQSQWVYCVRFSPDGTQVLSGGAGRKIQLWDVATGRELHAFEHPGWQQAVAVSPDGRRGLSGVRGWNMRLWDLKAGKQVRQFNHGAQVNATLFLPDGKSCLSIGRWPEAGGSGIKLWDVETGRLLRSFELPEDRQGWGEGHGWGALTGDGKTLLTCSGKVAILWSVETGKVTRQLKGHTGLIWTCAISTDGQTCATGGMESVLRVWRVEDGSVLKTSRMSCAVRSLAFSADGKLLAAGGKDGRIRLYVAPAWRPGRRIKAHRFIVESLDFSADGTRLLSGGFDAAIHLWSTKTWRRVRTLTGR